VVFNFGILIVETGNMDDASTPTANVGSELVVAGENGMTTAGTTEI
jgi:hypothetical protein